MLADGVHKSHNVSAIIWTCDAVGIATLHAISGHGRLRRHQTIAGGAGRWVDIELHPSAEAAFARFRGSGLTIVAAHAGSKAAAVPATTPCTALRAS